MSPAITTNGKRGQPVATPKPIIVTISVAKDAPDNTNPVDIEMVHRTVLNRFSRYARTELEKVPVVPGPERSKQQLILPANTAVPGAVKIILQWMRNNFRSSVVTDLSPPADLTIEQLVLVYQATLTLDLYIKPHGVRQRILNHVASNALTLREFDIVWRTLGHLDLGQGIIGHLLFHTVDFIDNEIIPKEDATEVYNYIQSHPELQRKYWDVLDGKSKYMTHQAKLAAEQAKRKEAAVRKAKRVSNKEEKARHEREAREARRRLAADGQRVLNEGDVEKLVKRLAL